jgi:hypothetical protein
MINIGIVDDIQIDRNLIMVTINKVNTNVKYVQYDINNLLSNNLNKELISKIEGDILSEKIQALIIDQSNTSKYGSVDGTDIYKYFYKKLREFPLVILTNYKDDALKENMVDSDKIYDKQSFLSFDDNSLEYAKKFIRNINRFLENKMYLERRINELKGSIIEESYDEILEKKLFLFEDELSNYKIINKSHLQKQLEEVNYDDIFNLIDRVEDILNNE